MLKRLDGSEYEKFELGMVLGRREYEKCEGRSDELNVEPRRLEFWFE
jgi:hypothetical protein